MKDNMEENVLLLRNLKDAGCDEGTIEKYFQLQGEGRHQEQFGLLSMHRAFLLDQLHISQNRIDCLDYLIYEMKKRIHERKGGKI